MCMGDVVRTLGRTLPPARQLFGIQSHTSMWLLITSLAAMRLPIPGIMISGLTLISFDSGARTRTIQALVRSLLTRSAITLHYITLMKSTALPRAAPTHLQRAILF